MIKAIIFDLDGVLVDAVEWHYLALNRALSLFGYPIGEREHSSLYNGLPTSVKLELLTQRKNFPRRLHGFVNEIKQQYTRHLIDEKSNPEARFTEMLSGLKAEGYVLGVASNSVRATVDLLLERMQIRQYFDVVLSNEDIEKPKPSPEIYHRCFEGLGLAAAECLVIEDSIPGIQAARESGANVAIVAGPDEVNMDFIRQNIAQFDRKHEGENQPVVPAIGRRRLEIVIPMAGHGSRFFEAGYQKPKPLIDVLGKPMIQWVVENTRPFGMEAHFTFLCNQRHYNEFDLDSYLSRIAPGCSIVPVPSVTEGAACTVLLAADHIDISAPLVIANSDQWVDASIDEMLRTAIQFDRDGMIMTFRAQHPKWSYAKMDATGRVTEVAEKKMISPHATTGIYYFKEALDFLNAAQSMVRKGIRTNNEFYVCPVYNELIARGRDVRLFEIAESAMHGLGTPEDLEQFLNWHQEKFGRRPRTENRLTPHA